MLSQQGNSSVTDREFGPLTPGPYGPVQLQLQQPDQRTWDLLSSEQDTVSRSDSYLVDPASSHMLVSKIKPCMSKYKPH